MILRHQKVRSKTGNVARLFESIAKSKRTALVLAAIATTSCAPDEVTSPNSDAAADEAVDAKPADVRTAPKSDVSLPPITFVPDMDASVDASEDVVRNDVPAAVDSPKPTMDIPRMVDVPQAIDIPVSMDVRTADVPIMVDAPRPVDMPVVVDMPRTTDTAADVRPDTGSSGCSSCRTQTTTPALSYPMGNSTITGGYSFVRPFAEARIRVNCAVNGAVVCERTFSAVGDIQTCNDGPNTITMRYNAMGSGMQRYVFAIECH